MFSNESQFNIFVYDGKQTAQRKPNKRNLIFCTASRFNWAIF